MCFQLSQADTLCRILTKIYQKQGTKKFLASFWIYTGSKPIQILFMSNSSLPSDRGDRTHALVLAVILHLSLGALLYLHAGQNSTTGKDTAAAMTTEQSVEKSNEKTLLMP
jgi:hypothetical protein